MTTAVTEREILTPANGRVPKLDSPAVSTRARARLTVTDRVRKMLVEIRVGARRWWVWTARPASLRAAWTLTNVDEKRVPGKATALRILWRISNRTDRLIMFALILLAPTAATGPLRWLAARPTRRWGLYLTLAALAATYTLGRN